MAPYLQRLIQFQNLEWRVQGPAKSNALGSQIQLISRRNVSAIDSQIWRDLHAYHFDEVVIFDALPFDFDYDEKF